MAPNKCCVGGCDSTSNTHRLFCMPMNDNLRNLWMSFLVPTNPNLLGLTKNQLMTKRVCARHFDQTQFDQAGVRIRYSYPCLFTELEIAHGVPLAKGCNFLDEHNYYRSREEDNDNATGDPITMTGERLITQEHHYSLPSTSHSNVTSQLHVEGERLITQAHQHSVPSTSYPNVTSQLDHEGASSITQAHQHSLPSTSPSNVTSQLLHYEECQPVFKRDKINKSTHKSTSRKFNSKTHSYIKQCTKIAAENLGVTNTSCLQNAQKYAENQLLMENFDKLNKKAKSFLLMQLRLATKNKMARRFSLQEKLSALALMKQSPKGYKLLKTMFTLPNKRTLARVSNKIDFECGVNKNMFEHIKNSVQDWDTQKKLCSIVFDEIALTPRLTYNESKDKIIGFVEIAGERKPKLADHALVFMIRGICASWRQAIAYYFCEGTVSAAELLRILKEIIPHIVETGLKPLALVCDQGSTFRSCFNQLKQLTARLRSNQNRENDCTIHIAGQDLFLFHDPPHLLKSIRNNFISKDILYQGKKASWGDITYIYDLDSKSGHTRALPKLTAQHVDLKHMNKMRVKMAAQVFSARTAAMLDYTDALHKRLNAPLETMQTTAEVVTFVDDLFDSVNGSPGQTKGKLRCAVKRDSPHQEFWTNAIKILKNMKYIDTNSKLARQTAKARHVRPPCLDGWNTTLESFVGLAKLLFTEFGVEYFYPRLINQDPLENFFGRIRAMNYRNVNPDANTFIYAFKSLVMSNILSPHSKLANCEEDDGDTLLDLNYLFTSMITSDENISPNVNLNAPSSSKAHSEPEGSLLQKVINEKVRVQTSAYTAGYMSRKITKKVNCNSCAKTYTTEEIQGIHAFIQYREYKRLKNSNLAYPNEKMLRLYRENSQLIHDFLNEYGFKNNIKKNLTYLIANCDMSWLGCKKHEKDVKQYYISLIIRLHCHNWCNILNKILCGKIEEKYVIKMQHMQKLALSKYKSNKLRQKKANK